MNRKVSGMAALFLGMFCFNRQVIMSDNIASDDSYSDSREGCESGFERTRLFQYDPIEIGHVRYVAIGQGNEVRMKTLGMDPPLFEIKNFLSGQECDYIKRLALEDGLQRSRTVIFKGTSTDEHNIGLDHHKDIETSFNVSFWREQVNKCDVDGDSVLDPQEMIDCLPELHSQNITAAMLDLMMGDIDLDQDSDGRFDSKELWRMAKHNPDVSEDIRAWLVNWRSGGGERLVKRWKGHTRVSEQTWLSSAPDDRIPLRNIQDRVAALTRLSPEIIYSSEAMQVVRYRSGGHYHAHYDSDVIDHSLQCRHTSLRLNQTSGQPFSETRCRLCRFVTILYYLNDVDEGGETAFPFADLTYESPQFQEKLAYDYTDLSDHCYDSSKVIKAERGKAIMWYNHQLDPETGGLGIKLGHSLHGGCQVRRGVKWIANNWISADNVHDRQSDYIKSLEPFLRQRAEAETDKDCTDQEVSISSNDIKHVQSQCYQGPIGGK